MIYVALYSGKSLMSRAIMWLNWSAYSHAALFTSRRTVIEAWATGIGSPWAWATGGVVREVPGLWNQHSDETSVDIFRPIGITDEECDAVENFCRAQVGKRYDWKGVFRFVCRRRPVSDDDWFCSELVAAGFEHAGFPLLAYPAQKVFPGMLASSIRLAPLTPAELCHLISGL